MLVKVEKLTGALFLVSSFISDHDPLKWRLRDKALEFFFRLQAERVASSEHPALMAGRLGSVLKEIVFLLQMAALNPVASEMNFTILKREYSAIDGLFRSQQLSDPSFGLEPSSDKVSSLPRPPVLTSSTKAPASVDSGRNKNQERRKFLADFLAKNNNWLSIRQIAQALPSYSSKTVQRDLAELVRAGILKKEGDRRWSRYLLVKNVNLWPTDTTI